MLTEEEEDSDETVNQEKAEPDSETPTSESTKNNGTSTQEANSQVEGQEATDTDTIPEETAKEEEINIREDWDGSTYYIEPEQSDKLDDEFRQLKREMKREEGVIVEKHRHFFQAVLDVSIEENLDEVLQRAKQKAQKDTN
jgi:hypothetical protein